MTPPANNLTAHLRDAARHLDRAGHSLERARDHTHQAQSDTELEQLYRWVAAARRALLRIARRELNRPKGRLR
jgi:hypothetical protein